MSSTRKRRLRGDQGGRRTRDRNLTPAKDRRNLSSGSNVYPLERVTRSDQAAADLHRLGVVCHRRGDFEAAMGLLAKAVQLEPVAVQYYHDLCETLLAAGRWEEALNITSAALEIDPTFAPTVDLRAQLLHRMGKTDQAIFAYEQLIDRGLASAEVHNNYASLFHESGRSEEARRGYEAALQANPNHIDAYFNLSDLARSGQYVFSLAQLATMEKLAKREDLLVESYTRLCFAIGVAYEQSKQHDQAFHWFRNGNESVRTREGVLCAVSLHDQHLQGHRAINQLATQLVGSLRPITEVGGSIPIFVLGMPRSGTTLVTEILAMHADVENAGEIDLLRPGLEGFMREWCGRYTQVPQEALSTVFANYLGSARSIVGTSSSVPRYFVDKTPENLLMLGFICQMLPEARVIWMRRDPCDVCWSCYSQSFRSERLASTTSDLVQLRAYEEFCRSVGEHWWRTGLVNGLRVSYEQLVTNPEVIARQVFEFLELPWERECLQFYKNRSVVRTASTLQVRRPLSGKSIGAWRRYEHHLAAVWGVDDPSGGLD